ncbi:uncharacterized protein LOC114537732 [Dendronephthya gigantea]|uniref:uncharacterized protein LOC114537732 n=1 Tax=Dendronephthya gigantea TaxID=151771 RepID=UPI001069CCA4|nr:uncharacterized protein LOC114537732 [Dendronephthya gigantea]
MHVNKFGRSYSLGKSLDSDLRRLIIDECLKSGGDATVGYLPVTYVEIASRFSISANTVSKIWKNFCYQGRKVDPSPKGGDHSSKFSEGDLELLEVLKRAHGTIQLNELYAILEEFGDCGEVSLSSISRAIKSRLLSGKRYTRKRITSVAFERFTDENMIYTQLFINYLSSKDPRRIKFFDEAGVKTPCIGTRLYGNAPSGERCVEIVRKTESPNFTLNLLISVNGPEYYNILDGPTDTVRFWDFFWEASQAAHEITRRPALEVGDIVVMDNLAVHHYEGGQILEEVLAEMGIELLFTPTYSPDLNPIELCFNKIKRT